MAVEKRHLDSNGSVRLMMGAAHLYVECTRAVIDCPVISDFQFGVTGPAHIFDFDRAILSKKYQPRLEPVSREKFHGAIGCSESRRIVFTDASRHFPVGRINRNGIAIWIGEAQEKHSTYYACEH